MVIRLHKCARTTPAIREEIRNSPLGVRTLARQYGLNRATVRKWEQSALIGGFSAGMFHGIGSYFDDVGSVNAGDWAFEGSKGDTARSLSSAGRAAKIAAHASAGGVMRVLQGGKFGHGFASAGFGEAVSPTVARLAGNSAARQFIAGTIVGGTAARLAGGKFANGAVTAAMSYAFASAVRRGADDQGRPLNENEIAAAKEAYGDRIKDYDGVRFFGRKWMPFQGGDVAMAPDGNIYWPAAKGCADLTACTLTTKDGYQYQALPTFIHEMGHVMQHQQGINVVLRALPHQLLHMATFGKYDPYMSRQQFYQTPTPLGLNVEAQADWYMHSFCTRTGGC